MMHLRFWKLIFIGISIWLVGWLFYKNLVPSGRFEAVYNFQNTPFISAMRPPERLTPFPSSGAKEQSITGDPVYFDLHLPSAFQDVEVTVIHKNPNKQKFAISAFTDRKNWKFFTEELISAEIAGGFIEGKARFKTAGLDRPDGTITFILGAPETTQEFPIIIKEIKAAATKKPISWAEIPVKIFSILRKKF